MYCITSRSRLKTYNSGSYFNTDFLVLIFANSEHFAISSSSNVSFHSSSLPKYFLMMKDFRQCLLLMKVRNTKICKSETSRHYFVCITCFCCAPNISFFLFVGNLEAFALMLNNIQFYFTAKLPLNTWLEKSYTVFMHNSYIIALLIITFE